MLAIMIDDNYRSMSAAAAAVVVVVVAVVIAIGVNEPRQLLQ